MLKAQGLNLGASILKFGFSNFQNNNLGILVALLFWMIELALMLRAFQSSFMVYKWTMTMQFSFEYCLDPKDHKYEEE